MSTGDDDMTVDSGTAARATTDTDDPQERFLAGVRAELADLPSAETTEMLDDVRAHLRDLTAELGPDADLTARLGTPTAYAAELRAAAGYPAAPVVRERPAAPVGRAALVGLVASAVFVAGGVVLREPVFVVFALFAVLLAAPMLTRDGPGVPSVAALPVVQRFLASKPAGDTLAGRSAGFLAALQPGWWVVRALGAAALVAFPLLGRGGLVVTVLLAFVTVPVSVWVGRLSQRDRRWLWAVVPLNTLAVVVLLFAVVAGGVGILRDSSSGPTSSQSYLRGLSQDGREIRDIRPVDSFGNPLTGVYLFDQDGQPINTSDDCYDMYGSPTPTTTAVRPFPRGTVDYDRNSRRCVTTPPGQLVVAVPSSPIPTTTPAPTTTPGPTTRPAPTTTPVPVPTR